MVRHILTVIYKNRLRVALIMVAVIFWIFVVGTVTILVENSEKITAIQAKLEHEAEVSGEEGYQNLLQEITELHQIVLQLIEDHSEEVSAIQEIFNEKLANTTAKLEADLNDANRRITELEEDQTQLESELTQDLSMTNEALHNARLKITQLEIELSNVTDRTSMIERALSQITTEQTQAREDLDTTGERLNDAMVIITLVEDGLSNTTLRTAVIETELVDIKIEVLSLNDTKASKVVVDEITDRVEDLETGKVDKTEFEILSDNVTSLRDQTTDFLQVIHVINNTSMEIQGDIVELTFTFNITGRWSFQHNT